jgi:hypothetical protein
MSSSPTQSPAPEGRSNDRPRRNAGWSALLWTAVILLALSPWPWW